VRCLPSSPLFLSTDLRASGTARCVGGLIGVYCEDGPGERAADNHPLLFTLDGRPIGTIRIDLLSDGAGVMRLVAVTESQQDQGHGRMLLELAEAFAREAGAQRAVVNAAPDATGFYARAGYRPQRWTDPNGPVGPSVPMAKPL
jgi:predicted N-acetyltransferase YhbS